MAPRGRPKKRLGRMDAAIDAMKPFGFDQQLVAKIVKQLLKEYGGDEGWAFIEEYGYKELIEALLRDQESNDEEKPNIQESIFSQDERAEEPALQSPAGPSSEPVNVTCNEAGYTAAETSSSVLGDTVGKPTCKELCNNNKDIGSTEPLCHPPAEGGRKSWKDIREDQTTSNHKETASVVCNDGGDSMQPGNNSLVSTPPPTPSPRPDNLTCSSNVTPSLPAVVDHQTSTPSTIPSSSKPVVSLQQPRRRTPCYGWIESDEEDDADFLELPPMKPTTPVVSQNAKGGTNKDKQRNSRWDIGPYDP